MRSSQEHSTPFNRTTRELTETWRKNAKTMKIKKPIFGICLRDSRVSKRPSVRKNNTHQHAISLHCCDSRYPYPKHSQFIMIPSQFDNSQTCKRYPGSLVTRKFSRSPPFLISPAHSGFLPGKKKNNWWQAATLRWRLEERQQVSESCQTFARKRSSVRMCLALEDT